MKKIVLLCLMIFSLHFAFSQNADKLNEVKLNIANTIAIASVEVGYERFVDFNQSLEFVALFNDRINYHSQKGSRNFNTNTYKLGYNYYFGEEYSGSGLYMNPFLKLRTGEFTETVRASDGDAEFDQEKVTDMGSFLIGVGAGYKWNFNDTFVLGPFINVGRNFSDEVKDRFSAIEFNAGFNIGYRF
ncbi:DUF3575 domain-containing protein [Gramella sp. AN32]|uniref:DUF3575 domain-containing protein n=1 Tax=Christiangramia antarctica TaxID=2058158 RepID=A0ABW5X0U9_9FLAO|nr:DUF3575 domain-containing protein [Gramella sp. AN32]MCM4154900.1 DUF3575 domain-containing protein [Gramella sp. AN32]